MKSADRFIQIAQKVLPIPFTIAVILTVITVLLVLTIQPEPPLPGPDYSISMGGVTKDLSPEVFEDLSNELEIPLQSIPEPNSNSFLNILDYWESGFWNLLKFAMQMILILVLGHALALTPLAKRLIHQIVKYCNTTSKAVVLVAFFAVLVGLINWGLGLIFGAILARKVGEYASQNQIKINYPMIGAAGYAGLMAWHGGLSGSAPLTVANPGHFLESTIGVIPVETTLFSTMNGIVAIALLLCIPVVLYLFAKRLPVSEVNIPVYTSGLLDQGKPSGAEHIDRSKVLAYIFAGIMVFLSVYKAIQFSGSTFLGFLTLNYVNFLLFGLAIALHGNFIRFIQAIDEAVKGASGIIIQFPIYGGIMGIMAYSGLLNEMAAFFIAISNETTLPLFTFISAAIVNVFVPSGGGQWAIQGPVVVESATSMGVPLSKNIMALVYGDQLTNMIQPFWALPLLSITGLKAKEILPYTFIIMCVGIIIFLTALLL